MTKSYTICKCCKKRFVIDEVDFCFNRENNVDDLCSDCLKFIRGG